MTESSPSEILSVIIPSIFLVFISTTLSTIYNSEKSPKWIFLEFLIIVLPHILNVTLFFPFIKEVLFCCVFLSLLVIILASVTEENKAGHKNNIDNGNKPFITNVRSTINLITVIAILAVDFKLFPKQFKKTFKYGYSLMDVGVGLFVFANAIVAPEIKGYTNSLKKTLIDALPLIILGVGRYISTTLTDYSVSVTEYGKHWNFFMTLAATRILSSLVLHFVKPKFSLATGIIILFLHEFILQHGVSDYVFGDKPRDNFIDANREGIVSSLGFVGLYFLSLFMGILLNLKESEIRSKTGLFLKLFVSTLLLFLITFVLEWKFFLSRRLANSAYCFWILSIGVMMTGLFYLNEIIQEFFYKKFNFRKLVHVPFIFDIINYNGLLFFLVANLLTGFVNMTFETLVISTRNSFLILVVYMMVNCVVVYYLYKVQVNLKVIIYKLSSKESLKGTKSNLV
ncbi:uncharacterized protein [Onthophagus taurus]|uniref:uncharacterized protein isoform X1 n=1 Tax=Onthophagus taurus TaxID=166361 RepID=UPI000C20D344|nr:uncharacterized protein At4g17910-like [Onthophagus taurus]XP_022914375.1 uncharacterized protein At4g17910-like [Onthophagus taurus]